MYDAIQDNGYPSAQALCRGALVCLADIPALKSVGLGPFDVRVELLVTEVEDDDGIYCDETFEVRFRDRKFMQGRPGDWDTLGTTGDGLSFAVVPFGTMELLKWLNDLDAEMLEETTDLLASMK